MYDYTTTHKADAYQVVFSDKDKADARKSIPTSFGGQSIRWDSFTDTFSVLINKVGRHAQEGDWVITDEAGKIAILTHDAFQKTYRGGVAGEQARFPATAAVAPGTPTGADRQAARQRLVGSPVRPDQETRFDQNPPVANTTETATNPQFQGQPGNQPFQPSGADRLAARQQSPGGNLPDPH